MHSFASANSISDERYDNEIEDDEKVDLNQHTRMPLPTFYSYYCFFISPRKNDCGVKKEKIV